MPARSAAAHMTRADTERVHAVLDTGAQDRTQAAASAGGGPRCGECARPRTYQTDSGRVYCTTAWCARLGIEVPLWRAAQADRQPGVAAGLPRPVAGGLPVPWVTVTAWGRVWWRALDTSRLCRAQNDWLCQMCGHQLGETAWVMATPEGQVLQAALHRECCDLAQAACPHLATRTRTRPRLVRRANLNADGAPLDNAPPATPDWPQHWILTTQ